MVQRAATLYYRVAATISALRLTRPSAAWGRSS